MKRGMIGLFLLVFVLFSAMIVFAENNSISASNSISCIDSDNGSNYYAKGYRINNNPTYYDYNITKWDYCIKNPVISEGYVISDMEKKVDNCSGSSCYLIEYICKSDLSDDHIGYNCPNGCQDGACISSPETNISNSSVENKLDFEYLVQNGNFSKKLDILFIPLNISNETFNAAIQNMLYSKGKPVNNSYGNITSRGLFKVEPFKSNIPKFNIEFSKKEMNFSFFNCNYGSWTPGLGDKPPLTCDWDKLKQNIGFEPDVIVIVGKDFSTQASGRIVLMGDPQSGSTDPGADYSDSFVHEFAHAFGGLTDEYGAPFSYNCNNGNCYYIFSPDPCVNSENPSCFSNVEKNIEITPNEDTLGCPSWCESYNRTKLAEISEVYTKWDNMSSCLQNGGIWFKQKHPWFDANCIPSKLFDDIGINCSASCVFSRHYSHVAFSPGGEFGGMMLNQIGDFNPPSFNHLSMALECCFPKNSSSDCKQFSEKFKNLPADVNPYFKVSYDQSSQCYNGETTEVPANTSEINISPCNGCEQDNKCYPIGYIKSGSYCSDSGQFVSQIGIGSCKNNFECSSNLCINSKCISQSFWQKVLDFLRNLLGG